MRTLKKTLFASAVVLVVGTVMAADAEVTPIDLGAESEGVRLDELATLKLIESGDAARGEEISKTTKAKCTRCHGEVGISDEEDTPSIAGQTAPYLYKQLMDYKTGARENRSMRSRVRKLSEQDLADLAVYYASLPGEGAAQQVASIAPPTLVSDGDRDRYLLPCAVCHGKNGEGMPHEVPALAGQKAQHLIDTMTEYKNGERTNDLYGRMRFVVTRMTDEEIEEAARYYASLGGS
jgi:cytochrome c553